MTQYAFYLKVEMMNLDDSVFSTKCWKKGCAKNAVFIFNFLDNEFNTCSEHATDFLEVLQETYRIFLSTKRSDAK